MQQIELAVLRVVDDPLVPAVVDGFTDGAKLLQRADIDKVADGFIIGSAIVRILLENPNDTGLKNLAEFTQAF